MRRTTLAVCLVALTVWPLCAEAELWRILTSTGEDPVVYDDESGLAWIGDMSATSPLSSQDYAMQLSTLAVLNAPGSGFHRLTGWHIATDSELETLVQNPVSDIALSFTLRWYAGTGGALGRYENTSNPPASGRHHTFGVTHLTCCEPFDMSPAGYGAFPYTELIEVPGAGNDVLYYAAPVPAEGLAPSVQPADSTASETLSAWAVTSNVVLTPDGTLAPAEPLRWTSVQFTPKPMHCAARPWRADDVVYFTPELELNRAHGGRIGRAISSGDYVVGISLKENRRWWFDPTIGRLDAFFRPTDVQPRRTIYRTRSSRDRARGVPDPCIDCFWLVCTQKCRIKGNAGKTNGSAERLYLVVDRGDNEDRATRAQLPGARGPDRPLGCRR